MSFRVFETIRSQKIPAQLRSSGLTPAQIRLALRAVINVSLVVAGETLPLSKHAEEFVDEEIERLIIFG